MPKGLVVRLGNLGKEEWVKLEARDMEPFGHRIYAPPVRSYYPVQWISRPFCIPFRTSAYKISPQSFNTRPQSPAEVVTISKETKNVKPRGLRSHKPARSTMIMVRIPTLNRL